MRFIWSKLAQSWVKALPPRVPGRVAIISDYQEPLLHPVTGEILDSKSQFRARTRDSGCVELGNDAQVVTKPPQMDRKELRKDIYDAISQVEAGYHPPVSGLEGAATRRYG